MATHQIFRVHAAICGRSKFAQTAFFQNFGVVGLTNVVSVSVMRSTHFHSHFSLQSS